MSQLRQGFHLQIKESKVPDREGGTHVICTCTNRAYGVRQNGIVTNHQYMPRCILAGYRGKLLFSLGLRIWDAFYWIERCVSLASKPTGKSNIQSPLGNNASVYAKSTDKKMRLITLQLSAPFLHTRPSLE